MTFWAGFVILPNLFSLFVGLFSRLQEAQHTHTHTQITNVSYMQDCEAVHLQDDDRHARYEQSLGACNGQQSFALQATSPQHKRRTPEHAGELHDHLADLETEPSTANWSTYDGMVIGPYDCMMT